MSNFTPKMVARRTLCLSAASMLALAATPRRSEAASAREIDIDVDATLNRLFIEVRGSNDLANRAFGILVFPSIVKAGFWVGGEYGEGALRINKKTAGYYNSASASIGFQLGVQARSVVIMFMTPDSLASFRRKRGWKVGVDGSVAIVTLGAGGSIDSNQIRQPVIGFILDEKGLMFNLTLEGSKISRIRR
jgi:lipid-binding SYLF domain-containing protein